MSFMNEKKTARLLKGFRDIAGPALQRRSSIVAKARKIAVIHGFEEIATPHLEYAEVLLGEGGETDKQVFRFFDHGDREVALRYDLTVPFARYVAMQHGKLVLPYKKLQIGTVFRGEKPQKGRYREFMQCDFDVIGSDSWQSEFEVLSALSKVLEFSVKDTKYSSQLLIELGHRQLLTALICKFLGDLDPEKLSYVFIGLDKLDKISGDKVAAYIHEHTSIAESKLKELIACLESKQANDLSWLRAHLMDQSEIIDRLDLLLVALAKEQQRVAVQLNLSIARGLAYYTGLVFETFVKNSRKLGSICSGGRYANLTERFGVKDLSGFGGSLGLDRLLALLEEDVTAGSQTSLDKPDRRDIFVALAAESASLLMTDVVQSLRAAGITTHMSLGQQKLAKQLRLANRLGVHSVIVVGENEAATKKYSLKDMRSGKSAEPVVLESLINTFISLAKKQYDAPNGV